MSILIKGMEMPKNCGECRFCHTENFTQWCCPTGREDIFYDAIPEWCPLEKPKTGWISVSERLPENSGCVLISIAGDIEFGAYDRQNNDWAIWRDGYWDEGKRADAWMPLPDPYREDGE